MSSDRFGLPPPNDSNENEEARAKRLAAVTNLLRDAFDAAVEHLGPEQAQAAWTNTARPENPKRGRPRKRGLSQTDFWLLFIYDLFHGDPTEPDPRALPRRTGEFLEYLSMRGIQSAAAVEKRLRRLIKMREEGRIYQPRIWPDVASAVSAYANTNAGNKKAPDK